jgi:hypothetical protein
MTLDDITDDLILECSSLVKANSILGCKKASVYVVYTRWKNLKKTNGMVEGQVGFHRPENVRRINVEKNNPIVRDLEKSREERHPDLPQEQQDHIQSLHRQKQKEYKKIAKQKQIVKLEQAQEKEARSYDRIFKSENMTSASEMQATADATAAEEYEDDFF